SRRRHTRSTRDWSSDVCSSDLASKAWPGTVLATNTSSMSIANLASAVEKPERFLGMHFFNPVPRSALIELITHPGTTTETLASRSEERRVGKEGGSRCWRCQV